jgi:hypothetical protein
MDIAFYLSAVVCGILFLVFFVYFILVVVQMFKQNQTGLGITCLATYFLCGGLGAFIALIMGWVKAGEMGIKSLMWQFTAVTALFLLSSCCVGGLSTSVMGKNANSTFMTVGSSIGFTPRP